MMDTEFEQELERITTKAFIDITLNCEAPLLFVAKLIALGTIKRRCNKYYELGFMAELVLAAYRKKLNLLKKTTTKKACETIQEPCAPIYHQYVGIFEEDGNWVAEEELIQWALASLRAPLPPDTLKRYFDLFQQVFGVDIQEIMQGGAIKSFKQVRKEKTAPLSTELDPMFTPQSIKKDMEKARKTRAEEIASTDANDVAAQVDAIIAGEETRP